MAETNLHAVDQEPVPSSLDVIVSFVDALKLDVANKLTEEGVSFVVIPGTVYSDSADAETRRLTVTVYDTAMQHGPRPDFRVAKFTTRITGGNGEITGPATSLVLTENKVTGESKVSNIHVINTPDGKRVTLGDSCDEEQLHLLALLLHNFEPKEG